MTLDLLYSTVPAISIGKVLVAVIVGGIVVGVGVGIIGWVALEIWSRIISIELRRQQENRERE